jgi:hypothetical protein
MKRRRMHWAVAVSSLLVGIALAGFSAQLASAQTIENPSVFLNSQYGVK